MQYVAAKAWAVRYVGGKQTFQLSYQSSGKLEKHAQDLRAEARDAIIAGANDQVAKADGVAKFLIAKAKASQE